LQPRPAAIGIQIAAERCHCRVGLGGCGVLPGLERALFPLLVVIERLGPIGVVDLADRVGRDYTTVSRQLARLQSLGLVARQAGAPDRRVRKAMVTPKGKLMTDAVDVARERLGRAIFARWNRRDVGELVRLMRKFADDINGDERAGES
jgi:DNA-binding MarR family transcriptional regulator